MNLYRYTFLFVLIFIYNVLNSQVNGKVYDISTNLPIENVNITCNSKTVNSNPDGSFSLEDKGWLLFNHIAYNPDSVNITTTNNELTIYLIPKDVSMNEVVVEGLHHQSRLKEVPVSVSLLKAKDLNLTASISYLDKLNLLPGIYVHAGTLNTNRITIRGIGSRTPYGTNRVKAFYNDIPLTSADGTTNIEDIDKSLINNIEVYKGPKSAVYGAGLGGIIVLSDKKNYKNGWHSIASFEAGMFNTYKPSINLNFKKKNFSFNAFYSTTQSEGFRKNSSFDRHNVQFKFNLNNKRNHVEFLFQYIDLKAHIPSSLNFDDFTNSPGKAAGNWLSVKGYEKYNKLISGLSNVYKINDKFSNKTIIYANVSDSYESRPFNILDDKNQRLGLKNFLNYNVNNWKFKLGFEIVNEQYDWDIYETNSGIQELLLNRYSERRNQASIFTDLKLKLNKLIIETGISYNYQNYQLHDFLPDQKDLSGEYRFKDIVAPFIGTNYEIYSFLHIYGSYSYGFSYPTVEETLLPDGQINTDLKPETGNCFELGFRWNLFEGNLFIDAGAYYLLINNLLVTERETEDIFTGKNAGQTNHSGFELNTVAMINKKESFSLPKVKFTFSSTLANNKFTNFIDNDIDYREKALPGIPLFNISSTLEFKYAFGLYLNINHHSFGKQYLDDANSAFYGAYQITHAKIGYSIKFHKKKNTANIYLCINNIFDKQYASMILVNAPSFGGRLPRYYYPGRPRCIQVGVSFAFCGSH